MKVTSKKCKVCGKLMPKGLNSVCSPKCAKEQEKLKKKKAKEKKSVSIPVLTQILDSLFSKYIRYRDCIKTTGKTTHLKCYTCDDDVEYNKSQNMHFIRRAVKSLRWNEDNCHGGCMRCNVILHGNYLEYFIRMEKEYGRAKVDEMISKKYEIGKVTREELQEKIEYYKNKLKDYEK